MTIIAQPASTSISLTPDKRVSMFFIDMRVIYRHDTTQIILLKVVNNNVVRRLRRAWQLRNVSEGSDETELGET